MKSITIRPVLLSLLSILFINASEAQSLTLTPSGGNKKASTMERIGITDVRISYDRPGVKGREGKIWGQLIPVGFTDLGFGTSKAAPWRAGANENTTIDVSTDIMVEGQPLPAGKYAFFVAYDPQECTLIFSKNTNSWGSFYYDPKETVLQVKVKPVPADKSVEWLKYEFTYETENSATVALQWEKLVIPFTISVDLKATQVASFRNELRSSTGFFWENWSTAAKWCADNNTNLNEALLWADTATSTNFGGESSFTALSTKADLLDKLSRGPEAIALMKTAIPFGNMGELHQYGRKLLKDKKPKEAFEVFKMNSDKHPDQFTTNMGMARGYSGIGNDKKALEYMQKALAQAPDPVNKANIEKMLPLLKEGKDINN